MRERVVRDIKEEFLGASFRYLVKRGLENTSIRDLCKNIGISSGSLYYWFENKDDIYINAAKYGLTTVAESLLGYACESISDPKHFFDNVLDEIIKYKAELKLIFQVATSPVYGERMREKSKELNDSYRMYAQKMSDAIGCSLEVMVPIIYLIISVILDYVVWEEYEIAKLQLNHLYKDLMLRMERHQYKEELEA